MNKDPCSTPVFSAMCWLREVTGRWWIKALEVGKAETSSILEALKPRASWHPTVHHLIAPLSSLPLPFTNTLSTCAAGATCKLAASLRQPSRFCNSQLPGMALSRLLTLLFLKSLQALHPVNVMTISNQIINYEALLTSLNLFNLLDHTVTTVDWSTNCRTLRLLSFNH